MIQNTIKMHFVSKNGHTTDYTSIATSTPFTRLNWRRWQRIKLYSAAIRAGALKRHGLLTLVRLIAVGLLCLPVDIMIGLIWVITWPIAWLHEQI